MSDYKYKNAMKQLQGFNTIVPYQNFKNLSYENWNEFLEEIKVRMMSFCQW